MGEAEVKWKIIILPYMFLPSLWPLSSLILYLQLSHFPPHQVTHPQGHTLNFVFTNNFIISVSSVLLSNHCLEPDSKSLISLAPQTCWSYHLLLSFNPFIPHALHHVLNYLISWLKSYDSSLSCLVPSEDDPQIRIWVQAVYLGSDPRKHW